MRNYIFHYRTMTYNRSHSLHVKASDFQEAMHIFLTNTKSRLFRTFRVEFL